MEKFYSHITSLYRIIVIGLFLYLLYEHTSGVFNTELISLMTYLGLYAVIFTIVKKGKWSALFELAILLGGIYYFEQNILYFLLIVPFIHFGVSKINIIDSLVFSMILSGYVYYQYEPPVLSILLGLALLCSFAMFNERYKEIGNLHREVVKGQKKSDEKTIELANKLSEIDIISKMFVELSSLNEIIEEQKIEQQMVESSRYFFNGHYACLYVKDKHTDLFERVAQSGKNDKFEVPDALENKQENLIPKVTHDYIKMPIQYEGQDWAILAVYGKRSDIGQHGQTIFFPFTDQDYEVLLVYTKQAMFKLKHAKLLQKNEYLANYDFLTGIPNRRYFWENFEREIEKAKRGGASVTLLILDVDHFKLFNDRFGHDTGDAVLRIVAETLQGSVRAKSDFVGRLGGEEFGVLLFNPQEHAFDVAEKIRRRVSVVPAVDTITVSIGLASYGLHGDTTDELYNNADKALYYSKQNGRNRVSIYNEEN